MLPDRGKSEFLGKVRRGTINGTGRGFAQKCTKIEVDAIRQNQQNGSSKFFITDKVQEIYLSDLV